MMHAPIQFTLFSKLPAEIRLKIWEATWPEARVIEPTDADYYKREEQADEHYDDCPEFLSLHVVCLLSTWQEDYTNLFSRKLDDRWPIEDCPNPVALQVCRESRLHTLKTFVGLRHAKLDGYLLYVNPQSDVLWVTSDAIDNPEQLDDLSSSYGVTSFEDHFKSTIVDQFDWDRGIGILDFFKSGVFAKAHVVLEKVNGESQTEEDYSDAATDLQAYDTRRLISLKHPVTYIDPFCNVYGQSKPNARVE